MILKTLHGKLAATLFALLCLTGILAFPLTLLTTRQYQREVDQNLNRPLAGSLAAHLASEGLLAQDHATLMKARAEIKRLMVINPEIDVYLLDTNGNVLACSGKPSDVVRRRVATAPMHQLLIRTARLPILGDDPRSTWQKKVFSVAPYASTRRAGQGQEAGYVYVILGGKQYDSVASLFQRSYILRSGALALAVVLALVAIAGLLVFQFLTRRLRRLTSAMDTFQELSYSTEGAAVVIPVFSATHDDSFAARDEIDRLSVVFSRMAERIEAQFSELARADTQRREMVSNVSHDLRTPLAALQGYLETLLMKEGLMTSDEQRGYLQIAVRQSDRLAKLVGELFELAQLDAREVQVTFEPFSLSELVQDVVQQHQITARQKSVNLSAILREDLPPVRADIAMIERVLDNLLDNALRYTPDGGAITLNLSRLNDNVVVQVADTGIGIAPENLPHITERFFRVPNQPDRPDCAGLGLAIVTRILELHGTKLTVTSVLDQGTAFEFSLPIDSTFK